MSQRALDLELVIRTFMEKELSPPLKDRLFHTYGS